MNLINISQIMPGKKDFVSIRQGDQGVHVQKRLILGNLKEVYQQFKEKHTIEKICFAKFSELCPRHCVFAGASGTHAVCVCTIHQNVKLMMINGKITQLSAYDDIPLKESLSCKNHLQSTTTRLLLSDLQLMPRNLVLKEHLYGLMDDNMIDTVQYKE